MQGSGKTLHQPAAPKPEPDNGRKPAMKLAVSACLIGEPCRYDGRSKPSEELIPLVREHEVLPVCPEVAGGLPTPRPPSEQMPQPSEKSGHAGCERPDRRQKRVRVIAEDGSDVTDAFERGAASTLASMLDFGCDLAVLKAKSPSCGSGLIYDGSFSGTLRPGWGTAAALIRDAGITVVDEEQALEILRERRGAQA